MANSSRSSEGSIAAAVTPPLWDLKAVVYPWVMTSSTPIEPADVPMASFIPSLLEHIDTTDD